MGGRVRAGAKHLPLGARNPWSSQSCFPSSCWHVIHPVLSCLTSESDIVTVYHHINLWKKKSPFFVNIKKLTYCLKTGHLVLLWYLVARWTECSWHPSHRCDLTVACTLTIYTLRRKWGTQARLTLRKLSFLSSLSEPVASAQSCEGLPPGVKLAALYSRKTPQRKQHWAKGWERKCRYKTRMMCRLRTCQGSGQQMIFLSQCRDRTFTVQEVTWFLQHLFNFAAEA